MYHHASLLPKDREVMARAFIAKSVYNLLKISLILIMKFMYNLSLNFLYIL